MTISYTANVTDAHTFGVFWNVLFKWHGSLYKLVWREFLAYLGVYYALNFLYRFGLDDDQQRTFQKVITYFRTQSITIPMSFVLGFYVTIVVNKWWEQYKLLPNPDSIGIIISSAISTTAIDKMEQARLMRRNVMRYIILGFVVTLIQISTRVKKRFPSLQHLVVSGLMLENEKKIFEKIEKKTTMSKYWMPLVWATNIVNKARTQNLITSDYIVQNFLSELTNFRQNLGALINYDMVSVPLVYTQVVTLVVYSYFIAALFGDQMIPDGDTPDLYFPLLLALQFIFHVGWLKVAEVLINPFGEDDDDFELNWLIDRHIKAAYMIVDEMHDEHPELLRDQYWNDVVPTDLPYTVGSAHDRKDEPKGSAESFKVKPNDALYANIPMAKSNTNAYPSSESVLKPTSDVSNDKGSESMVMPTPPLSPNSNSQHAILNIEKNEGESAEFGTTKISPEPSVEANENNIPDVTIQVNEEVNENNVPDVTIQVNEEANENNIPDVTIQVNEEANENNISDVNEMDSGPVNSTSNNDSQRRVSILNSSCENNENLENNDSK